MNKNGLNAEFSPRFGGTCFLHIQDLVYRKQHISRLDGYSEGPPKRG
jgi:hypothetical protein